MFTVALHEPNEPVTRSLVMALAVARVLERQFGLDVAVKWPNDVLVRGRKICGILADHDGWLYLGVGLNLLQPDFPAELADTATSVAIEVRAAPRRAASPAVSAPAGAGPVASIPAPPTGPDRDRLLLAVLECYRKAEANWHEPLSRRLWMVGEEVEIAVPYGPSVCGRLAGIAHDGCLLVQADRLRRIAAGEVSLRRGRRS